MPVFPLVGSTISMPGLSTPRFSASQIIAAPIRHFTEYAGFLPSILASTVAFAPSVTRLSLIRGVLPMLKELSAYTFDISHSCKVNLPYRDGPFSIGRQREKWGESHQSKTCIVAIHFSDAPAPTCL